jgi:hypothetical protein
MRLDGHLYDDPTADQHQAQFLQVRYDMLIKFRSSRSRSLTTLVLACGLACGADRIASVPADSVSRTIAVSAGEELRITLGNVGPAAYESPPLISSAVLKFVGVEVIPPFNPGGPTQQFRFQAVSAGQAIVRFRRLLGDSVVSFVEDTIQIR